MYIEEREKLNIKNKIQLSCTIFLAKYGSLDLYYSDMEKIFIISHEQLEINKNAVWTLIEIPEKPDGTFSGGECFSIRGDLFDRIQSTNQDINIMSEFISNKPNENESHIEAT